MKSSLSNKGLPTPQVKDLIRNQPVAARHKLMSVSKKKDSPLGIAQNREFRPDPQEDMRDPYSSSLGNKNAG